MAGLWRALEIVIFEVDIQLLLGISSVMCSDILVSIKQSSSTLTGILFLEFQDLDDCSMTLLICPQHVSRIYQELHDGTCSILADPPSPAT